MKHKPKKERPIMGNERAILNELLFVDERGELSTKREDDGFEKKDLKVERFELKDNSREIISQHEKKVDD